jgi:F0F1-type ATP synthase assembly protein I
MRPERPSQSFWVVASQLTAVAWEFLGSIMAGALLGWLADRQFRTAPWGLIGLTLFGTSTGLYRMIVTLKRFERRRTDE